jgi:hypothetical protein
MNVQTGPGMPMIHLPEKRCLNLRCPRFRLGFPTHHNSNSIITCDCGILFCSKDCQEEHREYGHKHACKHIKEAKVAAKKKENGNSSSSSSSRSSGETNEEAIEAQRLMQKNATWPCSVLFRGQAATRRFRVGQRVECLVAGGFNSGTIVDVLFRSSEDGPVLPYEIEMDTGMYTSAPIDLDVVIRRLSGAPVIVDQHQLCTPPPALLQKVKQEFQSGMQECRAARGTTTESPVLDKYRCSFCATQSLTKLSICAGCRTAAYCNRNCQKKHFKADHREACKAVGEARKEFKDSHPDIAKTKEGKRFIRKQSLTNNRVEMIMTFLQKTMGLPYGSAHMIHSILSRAFETYRSSKSSNPDDSLREMGEEMVKGQMESMFADIVVTSDALVCLVAAVLHFRATAPDLAAWCSVAVQLWFEVSRWRPVVPSIDDRE